MAMKNDTKFEEELTCYFKIYYREFDKFWPKHLKVSKIFTLITSFWANYLLFELKKYRGVISHGTEEWYKLWRGIDLSFQSCMSNLTNFDLSTWMSQKISF